MRHWCSFLVANEAGSTVAYLPSADLKQTLDVDFVSSVGPANPLPSFYFQNLGVEGSASGFERVQHFPDAVDGLPPKAPIFPSD